MSPKIIVLALSGLFCIPSASAATLIVDTTSDLVLSACLPATPADCSLRGAITAANANAGADTVSFDLAQTDPGFQAGTAHWRFALGSELPVVTAALTIDGFTQAGAQPSSHLPLSPVNHQLKIELRGPNPSSINCLLATGSLTVRGVAINNCNQAIFLFDGATHVIEGNYIGTDISGETTIANRFAVALGGDVRIGGALPAQANLLSGNSSTALAQFRPLSRLRVQGNIIGPNRQLNAIQGPQDQGINLGGPYADVLIGGSSAAEANTLGGHRFSAIVITDQPRGTPGPPLVRVIGNSIGAGVGGVALGNGLNPGSPSQTIPSITIGMLGNCRVAIGGDGPGEGNLIANGGNAGVAVNSCWGVPIIGNSFLANRGQPIDLATTNGFDGPTLNDPGDFDGTGTNPFMVAAGNRLQNTAEISTVVADAASNQLRITLRVDSAPTAVTYPLRIDFYATDAFGVESPMLSDTYPLADAQLPREYVLPLSGFAGSLGITVTDAEGNTSELVRAGRDFANGFEGAAAAQ